MNLRDFCDLEIFNMRGCAFLFVEAIKPLYAVRHDAHWNNRKINLLIIYTWPLGAVIKGSLLKIFVYEKWPVASVGSNFDMFTILDNHVQKLVI